MSRQAKISVISANYNGAEHLASCIASVARQTGVDVEHIVIDGGSKDASADILKQSSASLAYWCSEPDQGIADAMNKGISKTSGEWLLFLHSDDELRNENSLSEALAILESSDASIVGFPLLFGTGGTTRTLHPRGANAWLLLKTGFLHQSTFIHRSVFDMIGLYDTRLTIAMDYEFFLRAWKRKIPMTTCSEPVVSWMRDTGVSSRRDWKTTSRRLNEERRTQLKHSSGLLRLFYGIYWPLYFSYKKIQASI
ncbi:MAG: glycosyltransferase family 2 protein [Arenimonas sp.]